MKSIALILIRLWQRTLSQVLPPTCRFYPSCSEYGYQAISRYGILYGGWLTIKRVSRCHPFNPGGYDPVPDLETRPEHFGLPGHREALGLQKPDPSTRERPQGPVRISGNTS